MAHVVSVPNIPIVSWPQCLLAMLRRNQHLSPRYGAQDDVAAFSTFCSCSLSYYLSGASRFEEMSTFTIYLMGCLNDCVPGWIVRIVVTV